MHEVGHSVAARSKGVELGRPILVPAGLGFLGSFGAITFIRTELPNRRAPGAASGIAWVPVHQEKLLDSRWS